jgi:hypothetical protein
MRVIRTGQWIKHKNTGTIHEWGCRILATTLLKNVKPVSAISVDDKLCKVCNPNPNEYHTQLLLMEKYDEEIRLYSLDKRRRKQDARD